MKTENKVTSMKQLRKILSDNRIKISKHSRVYYADVVETNGDEYGLARAMTVHNLYQQLKGYQAII